MDQQEGQGRDVNLSGTSDQPPHETANLTWSHPIDPIEWQEGCNTLSVHWLGLIDCHERLTTITRFGRSSSWGWHLLGTLLGTQNIYLKTVGMWKNCCQGWVQAGSVEQEYFQTNWSFDQMSDWSWTWSWQLSFVLMNWFKILPHLFNGSCLCHMDELWPWEIVEDQYVCNPLGSISFCMMFIIGGQHCTRSFIVSPYLI